MTNTPTGAAAPATTPPEAQDSAAAASEAKAPATAPAPEASVTAEAPVTAQTPVTAETPIAAETAAGAEIRALLNVLAGQRRHVLGAVEGLGPDALRRPVLPSGWTCLGLVQHLALDVERFWFRAVLVGDPDVIAALDDVDDAWQVGPDVPHAEVLDRYRAESERADATVAAMDVNAPLAWWPRHLFGEPHLHTLRDVLLHVITETACHAGHLDAARELIDRRQWLVLT